MLELLDVAIGFATVMLAVSLIITSLTQVIVSVLGLRGANLQRGLEELFKQAGPTLSSDAKALSRKILTHPLVSDSALPERLPEFLKFWHTATAIKPEELRAALSAVKNTALTAEDIAFVDKWFDTYMARTSQWFVMKTRWITIGLAAVVVLITQLDTGALLYQLNTQGEKRAQLVTMSDALLKSAPEEAGDAYRATLDTLVKGQAAKFKADSDQKALALVRSRPQGDQWIVDNVAAAADAPGLIAAYSEALQKPLSDAAQKSIDNAKTLTTQLSNVGVIFPAPTDHAWGPFGLAVSIMFLSLGAPFWFNMLKNLSSLRSVVAQQMPEPATPQGDERQPSTTLPAPTKPVPPASPPANAPPAAPPPM